jgi:hypothetical protein
MWTYNCARVYAGDYSCGHIADTPQLDTYREVHCGFKIEAGKIIEKRLRDIRVKGATDSLNNPPYPKPYTTLQTYVLYPQTDEAIIRIFNKESSHLIKLVKHQKGKRSTIYKMRL